MCGVGVGWPGGSAWRWYGGSRLWVDVVTNGGCGMEPLSVKGVAFPDSSQDVTEGGIG